MYKDFISGKKAVFFDLDGTLIDSAKYSVRAINKILVTTGEPAVSELRGDSGIYIGDTLEALIHQPQLTTKELVEHFHTEYIKLFRANPLPVRKGFWDLVYELKNQKKFKIALISNSDRVQVDAVLKILRIDKTFDLVLAGNEVKHRKPHPEIYTSAAKHFGLKPKEILVFEDSPTGNMSAAKAKMDMIIIWNGNYPKRSYKGNILTFTDNFEGLSGNLDMTLKEYFATWIQHIVDRKI